MCVFRGKICKYRLNSSTKPPGFTGGKSVKYCTNSSPHTPLATLVIGAAILTKHIVYEKRHYFVRPAKLRDVQYVPGLFFSQHDVSFRKFTPPAPRTLPDTDICNKTYGNLLCVATGCSSCKISPTVLVEQIYTGLVDFVGWSWVLNFTAARGGFLKFVNKLYTNNNYI
jgi:hypothetical protein